MYIRGMDRAANTGFVTAGERDVQKRKYSGALRSRQTQLTRELILRATADAVADDPLLGFSMQEVSGRAGVSLRSLYRHFPGRRQLFEALYDWIGERMEVPAIVRSVRTVEGFPSIARELFARFESETPIVRAGVIASFALGTRPTRRAEWDLAVAGLYREALPELDPEEAGRAFALVRLLFSSRVWLTLTEQFHLDTASAAQAVEWAARTLIDDLKRRNDRQIAAVESHGATVARNRRRKS